MATPHLVRTPRTDATPAPSVSALFERCRLARWHSEVLRARSRRAQAEARATVEEVRQLRFVRLLAADFPPPRAVVRQP